MPNFRYKARDKYGRPASGITPAENKEAVLIHLKNAGYVPILIEESSGAPLKKGFFDRFARVKAEDLIMFTRQLVTLQSAGLPLLSSLEAIKEQTESKVLKDAVTHIIVDIESGLSFSDALVKHRNIFDDLFINMVLTGETSGTLDDVLERLASLHEYQMQTNAKIKSATMYPLIVVITLVIAFLAVITFVLPRFADLFSRFNVELPLPTRILLGINYFVQHWWHLSIVVIAFAIFFLKKYINTKPGRAVWDSLKLKLPIFGPLILKINMSRFARITSALIKSGIPLVQVLDMASTTVGNVTVGRAIEGIKSSVNEGKPMHEQMKQSKMFPPIVTQMVAVGENTGKLDQLLLRISEYYDTQVDYVIKNLTTAIEPILIFCLGGMVLTMALAIFLPMWNLIQVFRK